MFWKAKSDSALAKILKAALIHLEDQKLPFFIVQLRSRCVSQLDDFAGVHDVVGIEDFFDSAHEFDF